MCSGYNAIFASGIPILDGVKPPSLMVLHPLSAPYPSLAVQNPNSSR